MPSSTRALVSAASNWEELLAKLRTRPETTALAIAPNRAVMGVLAAPAAVACWIIERAPELARRQVLRLLVIGAEKLDAVDGGRWYQLMACLLGQPMTVQVTLVGDRLDASYRSPLTPPEPSAAVQHFRGSLASYLSAAPTRHDLAIMFHPGLQKHQGWLVDGSLALLLAAGTQLVAVSYEQDESEIDRYVAECHGFAGEGEVLLNPFYLDFSESGSMARWGRALWQFGARIPSPQSRIDRTRLAQLDQLAAMVMHSIALGAAPARSPGEATEFRAGGRRKRVLYHIFDDQYLDPSDGCVLAFRAGQFDQVARVSMDEVAAYPATSKSELARALWAAGFKAQHLMHRYPTAIDEAKRHELARSMHASLEHQVDNLFRTS